MTFPEWADGVFESMRPDAGPQLMWWRACRRRFELRWSDLQSDRWNVPTGAEAYSAFGRDASAWHARCSILYSAVTLDVEADMGMLPEKVGPAVRELTDINAKIVQCASDLAALFRRRAEIKSGDVYIDDQRVDLTSPDPYRLLAALRSAALNTPRLEAFGSMSRRDLDRLLLNKQFCDYVEPEWPDLLDQLTTSSERVVAIGDGDAAVLASGTKATKWSRWALRFLGELDAQPQYPRGFLRGCLTYGQLATLLEIALDATAGSYGEEQMRKLSHAYARRSERLSQDDPTKSP